MDPIRTCIVCRNKKNKKDLYRIVADNEKNAIIDRDQNINSRGIYICKCQKCISKLQKNLSKNKVKFKIDVENNSIAEVLKELGEEVWEK